MSATQTVASQASFSEAQDRPASQSSQVVPLSSNQRKLGARIVETIRHFGDLGFTAFGGPGVHVVILKKRFVEKLKWVDQTTFVDLFALGNALPGPGSTQLAFSIAVVRNGTLAGLIAFLFWSLPGAAGMAGLAAGVRAFPERLPPIVLGLLTGLNAAAVGLIALAAFQLSQGSITDALTRLIVLGSASFGICYHAPWMYPVLVFVGGLSTLLYDYRAKILSLLPLKARRSRSSHPEAIPEVSQDQSAGDVELEAVPPREPVAPSSSKADLGDDSRSRNINEVPYQSNSEDAARGASSSRTSLRSRNAAISTRDSVADRDQASSEPVASSSAATKLMVPNKVVAGIMGAVFILLIVVLVVVRGQLSDPPRLLDFFTNMVIAGVIIFGGGPVVIPLLRGYTVENGWVESRDFLLGFAILQAFPGPNFNFAVYLGVLSVPSSPALGGFLGWLGIFSPGILLKLALLPVYNSWRKLQVAKSVLRGLNAAASGLVFTAVWQLFLVGYIYTPASGNVVEAASASGPLTSDPFWGVVAASAFVATQWFKSPPALTVLMGALAGLAWFGVVGVEGTQRQKLV